tara:strand:- start:1315 stop:2337 length:1023 start_codon:yes stop_codon:yes gene_type:complete
VLTINFIHKLRKFLYSSAFTLLLTSSSFAVVSTPAPSPTLAQVASSMSFSSATNNNIDISQTTSQTSTMIDVNQLEEDVTNVAEDTGLEVDIAALEILSSSEGIGDPTVYAEISDNINSDMFGWDKQPTLDVNTMVFKDTKWNDLTKVTSSTVTGLSYSSAHNFFAENGVQQGRGATYINLAKGEISAKFWTRITRTGGSTVETGVFTGVGGLTAFPIAATVNFGVKENGDHMGSGLAESQLTLKKNATELHEPWVSETDSDEHNMDRYNNIDGHNDTDRFFMAAKAVSAGGASISGIIGIESGSCADSCTEQQYVESIERLEFEGTYAGKKWDGKTFEY